MTWQYIILHYITLDYITLHTNIHTASYRHLTNIYVKRNRSVGKEIAPPPWPVLWWRCGDDAGMTLRLIVKPHWNCEPRRQHPDFRATKWPILANHKDFSAGHGTSVVHSGSLCGRVPRSPNKPSSSAFSRGLPGDFARLLPRGVLWREMHDQGSPMGWLLYPVALSAPLSHDFPIGTSFHILYINMLYIYIYVIYIYMLYIYMLYIYMCYIYMRCIYIYVLYILYV